MGIYLFILTTAILFSTPTEVGKYSMLCLERGEHSCGDYIVSLDEGSWKCMKCGQEGMKR